MPRITDCDDLPHEYLTVPDFAAYLTVHDKTVRKWIRGGVLLAHRFDGLRRIAKTDAITYIERARFQS